MKNIFLVLFLFSSVLLLGQFGDGEELKFDISYGIITAGSVKMTVENSTWLDSIPTFVITSTARTTSFFDKLYKVRDEIKIEFGQDDFQSYKYSKKLREGSYRQNRINLYYPELEYSILHKKDKNAKTWKEIRYEIPVPSYDIFTTFFRVRSLKFAANDTLKVTVTDDGDVTTVDVVVHGIKKMKTIFGDIDCYILEPVLKGTDSIFKHSGDIFIYLTADDRKIPVLLESEVIFGSFRAKLTAYKPAAPPMP